MNYTFVFNQFFIVCLAYFLFRNKKSYVQSLSLSRKIASLLFILLTLCAGYATLFATFSEYAIYEYLIFVIIVSNFFISFLLIRTSKEINLTFQILFLHAFIICLLLIAQFTKGSQLGLGIEEKNALNPSGSVQFEAGNTFRPGGYFFDPNVAATWIIMIFPIFFTYALESKNYSFLTLPVSLLTSFAVVITKSRTAWIIFPFILSGLLYLAYRSKKFSTLTWRIFVSVFLFFLISASALFFQRIENFSITFSSTGGFYSRIDQYKVGLEYLFANPAGIGAGMIRDDMLGKIDAQKFAYDVTEPHNIFLEVADGAGIMGVLLFTTAIYVLLREYFFFWKKYHDIHILGVLLSCASFLYLGCFYPWLMRSPLPELFFLIIGISPYALRNKNSHEKNTAKN